MIKVNFDLSHATDQEKEAFLTLPHVASAIDTLVRLPTKEVKLSLVVDNGPEPVNLVSEIQSQK